MKCFSVIALICIGLLFSPTHVVSQDASGTAHIGRLIEATKTSDTETVRSLLSGGVKVDSRGEYDETPLMWAAGGSTAEMLNVLLEAGADIDAVDTNGDTALIWAINQNNLQAVKILLSKGAQTEIMDRHGLSAISWAASKGHLRIINRLIEAGADIDSRNENGSTALMWAIWERHPEAAEILIAAGADVNNMDTAGYSPLILAIVMKNVELAGVLLEAGADPNLKDKDGRKPIHWVEHYQSHAVGELIEQKIAEHEELAKQAQRLLHKGHSATADFRHRDAIELLQAAAAIDAKLGSKRRHVLAYELERIAFNYAALGQFDIAYDYLQQAMETEKELTDTNETTRALLKADIHSDMGDLHYAWGAYDLAEEHYNKAKALCESKNDTNGLREMLDALGRVYLVQGRPREALTNMEKALSLVEEYDTAESGIHGVISSGKEISIYGEIGRRLNSLSTVYLSLGRYEKAHFYLEQAVERAQNSGRLDREAKALGNIGDAYRFEEKYDEAMDAYRQALEVNRSMENPEGVAENLHDLGVIHFHLDELGQAAEFFNQSIALKEDLRSTAEGAIRRDYLASQLSTYQWLVKTYLRDGDSEAAFDIIELSSAKYLIEQIGGDFDGIGSRHHSIASFRRGLDPDVALLNYSNFNRSDPCVIYADRDRVIGYELDWKDLGEESVRTVADNRIAPSIDRDIVMVADLASPKLEQTNPDIEAVIRSYRSLISRPGASRRKNAARIRLGESLYRFLLEPIEKYLEDKSTLIIIPDGILAFLPFETLIQSDGRYLSERFHIKYIQSVTVSELISERQRGEKQLSLLAYGGAVYDDTTYQTDMIRSAYQLQIAKKEILETRDENSDMGNYYHALGFTGFSNLPGTLEEVQEIRQIVPQSDIRVGRQASEALLKRMSAEGNLENYGVLHFATHGIVVPEIPELSALVLSLSTDNKDGEDGFLTMGEIAALEIQADYVNLSACETGLGKIYGGEGVVGLTQAFLVAGANGLSVSLWQVADESTKEFMVGMYRLVYDEGYSFPHAITEMKRRFIKGRQYGHPFFWAPFVYYGSIR